MSDTRDPATDQQLPETNDRPFVQDLVITDIGARMQLGIRKYGTALQAGNGRNMLLDAYEEALDLAIYLRGALEEQQAGEPPRFHGPAVETVEWGVRHPRGIEHLRISEHLARMSVERFPDRVLLRRTRVSYPDRVSEWTPVERQAGES